MHYFSIVICFICLASNLCHGKLTKSFDSISFLPKKSKKLHENHVNIKRNDMLLNKNELLLNTIALSPANSSYFIDKIVLSLFPIQKHEISKFIALSSMMFWLVYIFTLTRDIKDSLLVTSCGAESIAFLKVYGTLPMATIFMIFYSKLSNKLNTNQLFYITIIPFFLFYALFGFVLYPLRDLLHPVQLLKTPNNGWKYIINLLRYWIFTLYYIISDVWGSAGVPLLFWSLANDVMQIDQAKRLYPCITLIGNIAPIVSGSFTYFISSYSKLWIKNSNNNELPILPITISMMIAGSFVLLLNHYIRSQSNTIIKSPINSISIDKTTSKVPKEKVNTNTIIISNESIENQKPKMTLWESLQFLASDKYLRNIAIMVLSYGLTIEFTEIIWKANIKNAFPNKNDYMNFQGKTSFLLGISSFIMMFVGTNIIKFLNWKAGALTTPLVMGFLGIPFFLILSKQAFHISSNTGSITSNSISSTNKLLLLSVYIGLLQNVLSKGTKYSIFDPTKEMLYIPLDKNSKTKGKAAIDVLGARLGKSGGALIQQLLVMYFGNISLSAPILGILFYGVIYAWICKLNNFVHYYVYH